MESRCGDINILKILIPHCCRCNAQSGRIPCDTERSTRLETAKPSVDRTSSKGLLKHVRGAGKLTSLVVCMTVLVTLPKACALGIALRGMLGKHTHRLRQIGYCSCSLHHASSIRMGGCKNVLCDALCQGAYDFTRIKMHPHLCSRRCNQQHTLTPCECASIYKRENIDKKGNHIERPTERL